MVLNTYKNRIINASQGQLLVITYELLIEAVDQALKCIKQEELPDKAMFSYNISQAQKYLKELTNGLDMSYDISVSLITLYIYTNQLLVNASIQCTSQPLLEVKKLLSILLKGWNQVASQEKEQQPIMENTQKIYAGLTYSKETLNEIIVEDGQNRGIQA